MSEDEYHLVVQKPQSLEEFADEVFWRAWDSEYKRDLNEVFKLKHPPEGACLCGRCVERDRRRFSELAQKWFGTPKNT